MSSHKEMLFLLLLTHPDPACAHTAAQQRAGVRSAWPAPSTPGAGTPTPPRAPRCPRLFCQAERCHASAPTHRPHSPSAAADSLTLPFHRAEFAFQQKERRHLTAKSSSLLIPFIERSKFSFQYILNKQTRKKKTTQQTRFIKPSAEGPPQLSCHLCSPFEDPAVCPDGLQRSHCGTPRRELLLPRPRAAGGTQPLS